MSEGWIKLHRQLLESSVWENPNITRFWIWCLLRASHRSAKARVGYTEVELAPGQLVYGSEAAARETGLPRHAVRACVKTLKEEKAVEITVKKTNHISILTIVNWGYYQSDEDEKIQQPANHSPTTRQQHATNKNDQETKLPPARVREVNSTEWGGDPSSAEVQEAALSPEAAEVWDYWVQAREAAGLKTLSRQDKPAAARWAAEILAGRLDMPDYRLTVDNLLADPEARIKYSLGGLLRRIDLWINRTPRAIQSAPSAPPPEDYSWVGKGFRSQAKALGIDLDALH